MNQSNDGDFNQSDAADLSGVKREGGRAGTALEHPPTTPIPHAWRWVHMWSVGAAGTTARANALTQIVPNLSSLYTLYFIL